MARGEPKEWAIRIMKVRGGGAKLSRPSERTKMLIQQSAVIPWGKAARAEDTYRRHSEAARMERGAQEEKRGDEYAAKRQLS